MAVASVSASFGLLSGFSLSLGDFDRFSIDLDLLVARRPPRSSDLFLATPPRPWLLDDYDLDLCFYENLYD